MGKIEAKETLDIPPEIQAAIIEIGRKKRAIDTESKVIDSLGEKRVAPWLVDGCSGVVMEEAELAFLQKIAAGGDSRLNGTSDNIKSVKDWMRNKGVTIESVLPGATSLQEQVTMLADEANTMLVIIELQKVPALAQRMVTIEQYVMSRGEELVQDDSSTLTEAILLDERVCAQKEKMLTWGMKVAEVAGENGQRVVETLKQQISVVRNLRYRAEDIILVTSAVSHEREMLSSRVEEDRIAPEGIIFAVYDLLDRLGTFESEVMRIERTENVRGALSGEKGICVLAKGDHSMLEGIVEVREMVDSSSDLLEVYLQNSGELLKDQYAMGVSLAPIFESRVQRLQGLFYRAEVLLDIASLPLTASDDRGRVSKYVDKFAVTETGVYQIMTLVDSGQQIAWHGMNLPVLKRDEESELFGLLGKYRRIMTALESGTLGNAISSDGQIEPMLQPFRTIVEGVRDVLVRANIRLVVKITKEHWFKSRDGLPFLDLVQEGNIGLLRAIDRFDVRTGNKLSTYATWWVRQAITRALMNDNDLIRTPIHAQEKRNRVVTAQEELRIALEREPTAEEIYEHLGGAVPPKAIQSVLSGHYDVEVTSLHGHLTDSDRLHNLTMEGLLPDPVAEADLQAVTDTLACRELWDTVISEFLKGKKEDVARIMEVILTRRYLVTNSADRATLETIAKDVGRTRERVRQIEEETLRDLRKHIRSERLQFFIGDKVVGHNPD